MGGMGSGADGKRTVGVGKKRKEKWERWLRRKTGLEYMME